ncbi:hypothetical protein [uncultured Cutibacterium sp.]|uniref:hypothetical protein n=1 Tax=uncultured Cutibacterium sp. TaxID=1912223 RepID=UPI00259615CD|nr:hypothetical protein [uncultured Cutibacterium sp.]
MLWKAKLVISFECKASLDFPASHTFLFAFDATADAWAELIVRGSTDDTEADGDGEDLSEEQADPPITAAATTPQHAARLITTPP